MWVFTRAQCMGIHMMDSDGDWANNIDSDCFQCDSVNAYIVYSYIVEVPRGKKI